MPADRPRFKHRGPVGSDRWAERRAEVEKGNRTLRAKARQGPPVATEARLLYAEISAQIPAGTLLAHGIDCTGSWAQIGDYLCHHQPSPLVALRGALAMWRAPR